MTAPDPRFDTQAMSWANQLAASELDRQALRLDSGDDQ
jgi:hypothetical protein